MKRTVLLTVATLLFATVALTSNAQNGNRKRVDLKSEAINSRGANPHIKADRPTTDAAAASRGMGAGTCYIYLHNYTAYSIDIYVDGYWEGTLGAYADSYVPTGTGYTTLYGASIGRTKEWNFDGASCNTSTDYYFY